MNFLSIIMPPIIGAIIGYITNWLAVKMLFRPFNPIKIGKFTCPFTPGLIPKSKPRLAKALGEAVSSQLLNEKDFVQALLSDNIITELNNKVELFITNESSTLKNMLISSTSLDAYNNILDISSGKLSDIVLNKLEENNIGNLISQQIQTVASEKMKGSLIGFFGGNSIVSSLGEPIEQSINTYIAENGKSMLNSMIKEELVSISETNISNLATNMGFNFSNISEVATKVYTNFVTNKVSSIINTINISSIIENKILEMDLLDLEKLILSVMKNELKALVNLGALIGFILGLINIFF